MIKLTQLFDGYAILQGKRDKVIDSLIKQMGNNQHIEFHLARKGKYRLQLYAYTEQRHTKYFNYMITQAEMCTITKSNSP